MSDFQTTLTSLKTRMIGLSDNEHSTISAGFVLPQYQRVKDEEKDGWADYGYRASAKLQCSNN